MEARKPDKLHSVIPITNFDRDLALRHLKAQYLATNRDVASTGPVRSNRSRRHQKSAQSSEFQARTGGQDEMTKDSLRELYVDELKDLYSAEKQLTKALPKMAKAATSPDLKSGFENHLEQTEGHVERLEEIFGMLEERPGGKKCVGMEGLIKEGSEMMDEDFSQDVLDAALIAAAQRVEHYEIAAYGTVAAYADLLGESEHASLLRQTLEEEKDTDRKLTELSEDINISAEADSSGQQNVRRKPRKVA